MTTFNGAISNLTELLQYRAACEPNKTACIFLKDGEAEEGRLTYRELDIRARSIAARLQAVGAKGERAILLYPPSLEYIAGFFGCLYAGVIAVPAYPPHPARLQRMLPRLTAIIKNAEPSFLMTTSSLVSDVADTLMNAVFTKFKPGLRKLLQKAFSALSVKVLHSDPLRKLLFFKYPEFGAMRWLSTDDIPRERASDWKKPALTRDSLAFLQYTSGSTGTPKGVMVSHGNLLYNSALISQCFEIVPDKPAVIWLPPYHDMGLIGGILQPIYSGFPVILMSPVAFLQQPFRWLQAISRYKATISGGPNFAYDLCVRKITPEQRTELDLSSWDVAFNGAEPIRPDTLERFSETFQSCGFRRQAFYPCYGLAEGTLIVSGGSVTDLPVLMDVNAEAMKNRQAVPAKTRTRNCHTLIGCGKNLTGQQIAIVNPDTCKRCQPDEIGEIWVSGNSVAQGYWERPEETRLTFQAVLSDTGEGPFLRTGDLGFLHDGELFVTGRLKDLIIIRGRNHYPQDIELTAERSHPRLRPGCSAAFDVEIEGEKRLMVAVEVERRFGERRRLTSQYSEPERRNISRRQFTDLPDYQLDNNPRLEVDEVIDAIRQAVSEQHELQVYGVLLLKIGTIPKTSSGKIQRHACKEGFLKGTLDIVGKSMMGEEAARQRGKEAEDVQRSNSVSYLVNLTASIMKISPSGVDIHQPLTALGLDSMMAIELSHSLEMEFGMELPLNRLLEGITIAQLGQVLEKAEGRRQRAEDREQKAEDKFSLSYNQKSLWFMHCLAPDSAAYNVSFGVRIRSGLDIPILQQAFQTIIKRHPSLRTTYAMQHDGPIQQIQPDAGDYFQIIDASEWTDEVIHARLLEDSKRPFNLEKGPVLRVNLFACPNNEHILLLSIHHIATDLWSFSLMLDELDREMKMEGGRQKAESKKELRVSSASLPLPLSAFVSWQTQMLSGPEGERLWNYWKQRLSGEIPALNLPTDHPRPAVQSYHGDAYAFRIDKAIAQKIKALSQASNATLFTTLLAAFQVLLYRYSGQTDILTGSPAAGRTRPEFADVLGYFVNPVVIRSDLSGNPSFSEFLSQVRQSVLDALAHQDYPFQLLVERLQPARDPGRSPLFQVMFVLQKPYRVDASAPFVLKQAGARMNLGGVEMESVELQEQIAQFDLTLTMVEADGGLIGSFEYNTDLFEPDTIARMSEHFQTLLEGIAQNPEQSISQLPLLTPAERHRVITEFNDTCAEYPADKTVVDLFEERAARSPDAVAVVFEHLRLTYRELNEQSNRIAHFLRETFQIQPDDRVGLLMERSEQVIAGILGILKAGGAYVPMEPSYPEERIHHILTDSGCKAVLSETALRESLNVGEAFVDIRGIRHENTANPNRAASPCHLAYVIYTSGSTGVPKGVLTEHRSVVNMVSGLKKLWYDAFGENIREALTAPFVFDVSVQQIFVNLVCGNTLCIASDETRYNPRHFKDFLEKEHIQVIDITPAFLSSILECRVELPGSLRHINIGAEVLLPRQIERFYANEENRHITIANIYGPTEACVNATVFLMDADYCPNSLSIPIGKPLSNVRIFILDTFLNPVPIGVPGEIFLAGEGLARGYLNNADLTKEKFPQLKIDTEHIRVYRTGDLGRWLSDGTIEFLGRNDDQVKIRGYRIELGEIENQLLTHKAVSGAAVVAKEFRRNLKELAAYFTGSEELSVEELRRHLKAAIPDYMIPSYFIRLEQMPLLPSGKIDRRALPVPENLRPHLETAFVTPQTQTEQQIAEVWREALGLDQIGIHDNFFDLGGHSLMIVQIQNRLKEMFQKDIPVAEMFRYPTIAALARYLNEKGDRQPECSTDERSEARTEAKASRKRQRESRLKHRTGDL